MPDLAEIRALAEPRTELGDVALSPAEIASAVMVMPYRGCEADVSRLLLGQFGVPFPGPGQLVSSAGAEIWWFGKDAALLFGQGAVDLGDALAGLAAVTDQGDGWAGVDIEGRDAVAVLSRLCPVDLGREAFPPGTVLRTEVGHMMAGVANRDSAIRVLVMRSFVMTLWGKLSDAARSVAASNEVPD